MTQEVRRCLRCGQERNSYNGKSVCQSCLNAQNRATMLRKTRVCKACGKEFHSDTAKQYCSDECQLPHSLPIGHFKLRKRDKFQCVYCGKSSIEDEVELALDHIIPRSKGGTDTAGNLVTSCHDCNIQKADTELPLDILERIVAEVRRRNQAHRIHDEQPILFAR